MYPSTVPATFQLDKIKSYGDAMYKSSINPWSKELTGTQGKDPGYDPLAFIIQEAHTRGMKVHAWLNPYRVVSSGTDVNVLSSNHLARQNPSLLIENRGGLYYNPDLQEVKDHISNTVWEIVSNYDIDGITFDDYFYPGGLSMDADADLYAAYKADGGTLSQADWRRENVNDMVRMVNDFIKKDSGKPWLPFGIGPA